MDSKNRKTKQNLIYFVVLTTLIILFLVFGERYLSNSTPNQSKDQKETTKSSNEGAETGASPSSDGVQGAQTKDQEYYNSALDSMYNKDYSAAIDFFNKAIAANPNNPAYYSGKAQALVNLNQQLEAKATLEQGIASNPDDQLLRSKLDVLNKDFLAPSDQETPKQ